MFVDEVVPEEIEEPEPEPPTRAAILAKGDADAVWLSSGASEYHLRPGAEVPGGTYIIHAVFGGAAPMKAGEITVNAGADVTINCSSFAFRCTTSQ